MNKENKMNKNLLISLVAGVIIAAIVGITVCVKHVVNEKVFE